MKTAKIVTKTARQAILFLAALLSIMSVAQAQLEPVNWTHLSSAKGDLPVPPSNSGQSGLRVMDLDEDGQMDYLITFWGGPAIVWYRHVGNTFVPYMLEDTPLDLSHGERFQDIDGDGDQDLMFGQNESGNDIFWWENPKPVYSPGTPWVRRQVRNAGANFYHDEIWGDFDGNGTNEFLTWNQEGFQLLLLDIPADPFAAGPWPATPIFTWTGTGIIDDYRGVDVIDIDLDGTNDFVGGGGWFKHNGGTSFTYNVIDDAMRGARQVAGQVIPGGRPEIVTVLEKPAHILYANDSPLNLYQWTGSAWQMTTLLANLYWSHTLQLGDVNGDGNLDILTGELGQRFNPPPENPGARLMLLYGDGAGNFTQQMVFLGQGTLEAKLADIDNDGDLDIVGNTHVHNAPRTDIWINESLAPVIQPQGGTFAGQATVSLSSQAGDAMYYTIDGSPPTTSSTLYMGPFTVNASGTVRAVSARSGVVLGTTITSAAFTITADAVAPTIVAVEAAGNANQVRVRFSEPVNAATAQTAGNYTIDQGVVVNAAVLDGNFQTVVLTTTALSAGPNYTLTVNNVSDRAAPGNVIQANSQETFSYQNITTTGLALWLKASEGVIPNGGGLSQWNDLSGNNRHATQPLTPLSEPTMWQGALNGLPAVRFDGQNDFMSFNLPVNGLTGMTIFLVGANTQNQAGGSHPAFSAALFWNEPVFWGGVFLTPYQTAVNARFGTTQFGNNMLYTRPVSVGTNFSLSVSVKDGSTGTDSLYVNGTQVLSQGGKDPAIAGCDDTGNLGRGYDDDTYFAGDIAEVLVFTRALTDPERQAIEQYLDGKYGVSLSPAAVPQITDQPDNTNVDEPTPANFSVTATGNEPLAYQWRRGGVPILGATSSTFQLLPSTPTDNGAQFDVVVSNPFGVVTSSVATLTITVTPPGPPAWQDATRRYRVPVSVNVAAFQRLNKPANAVLNFSQMLTTLGTSGSLIDNSLRVIEVSGSGELVDLDVPYQFDKVAGYDAANNAQGTMVFLLEGNTTANITRYFQVYFDTTGSFSPPSVPTQVTITDGISHEGQDSYQITTPRGTYYYHKQGAAFASMEDIQGNDWIGYHPTGGASGSSRGLPNMGEFGHPGFVNGTSTILNQGPLKTTIQSVSLDGEWRLTWEIYADYATMSLLQAGGGYFLLYEGTPGGTFESASDTWTRSSGETLLANSDFFADLPSPEWVYFGDGLLSRILYFAHHEDDAIADTYWQLQNSMTVFGFGRNHLQGFPGGELMTAIPAHLTVGFSESTALAGPVIDSAYRDLTVSPGAPESQSISSGSISVSIVGSGSVVKNPDQPSYTLGQSVQMTAVPNPGANFIGWSGALSGTANPQNLIVNGAISVTATFGTSLAITQQPVSLVVTQGANATFTVGAVGNPPVTYQWRFNGGNIGGATGTSYVVNNAQPANAGNYQVVVTNPSGSLTSQVATLTITDPGSVPLSGLAIWLRGDTGVVTNSPEVSQWTDQSGNNRHATQATAANRPVLLDTSSANGLPVLRFDGVNDFMTYNLPVNGLTGMSIFLVAANTQNQTAVSHPAQNAAMFWNETAAWGAVFLSPFRTNVNARFGTLQAGNSLMHNRAASVNSGFTLSTAIKDGATDSLYVNGAVVLSENGKLTTIAGCQSTANLGRGYNDNTYFGGDMAEVLVYTRALTPAERAAVEDYLDTKYGLSTPPQITAQPADQIALEPAAATFSASLSGGEPLFYQWRRNGTPINGATNDSYVLNPTSRTADNGAQFDLIVTNSLGAVTSQVARLTVLPGGALSMWLRGDAGTVLNGSAVTQWSDQSGNNRHAAQATAINQPVRINSHLNGLPIVRFDGASDFLTFNLPVNGLSGMTIFLVAANTQNQVAGPAQAERAALFWNENASWGSLYLIPFQTTVRMRFGTTQSGNQPTYTRPVSAGSAFTLSTSVKNGTTDSLYVNKTLVLSQGGKLATIAGCVDIGNVGRGYNDDTYYAGDIAEVLVYAQALSDAERQAVEQYLDSKYALTPPTIPQITVQPANANVVQPNAANFNVQAIGTLPLSYQWRRGGVNIPGATGNGYTLTPTSVAADNGAQFTVVVSNSGGSVTSSVATLTVTAPAAQPPTIQTQPANVGVIEPNAANFSVTATGTPPLTYQWRRGGVPIGGATSSNYTLNATSVAADNGAQFTVVVSNSVGSVTSVVATLTVNAPGSVPAGGLALWLQADAGTVLNGSAVTQWSDQSGNNRHATQATAANQPQLINSLINGRPAVRFDGANDFQTFNLPVNGFTGMSIFMVAANRQPPPGGANTVQHAALFWNETAFWGGICLTPYQSSVNLRFGTTQSGNNLMYNRPLSVGTNFTMSAAIKNGTTDTLYVNGASVLSQGGQQGTIAGCQNTGNLGRGYNDDTFYTGDIAEVLVYDRALSDVERQQVETYLNNKYAVIATTAPLITTQPANVVVNEPNAANFSVTATGTPPLGYQWRRGGVNIGGATSSSYTLTPTSVAADNGAQFSVVVSNASGMVTSAVATLTVNAPGSIPAGGLSLWLQADVGTVLNGSAVTQWTDQSGNNRHATQSGGASQPQLLNPLINGRPAVRFDGLNDFLTFNLPVNNLTGMSIFMVAANRVPPPGGANNVEYAALFWNESAGWAGVCLTPNQSSVNARFGTTQSGNNLVYNRPASVGTNFTLSAAIKNGATDTLYVNGISVLSEGGKLTTITGCQNTGNLGRGYNDNTYYTGDIAEVLVYDRALSDGERQIIEAYLNGKYGVIPSTSPQITSQPASATVIEPNAANFSVTATGSAPLAYQWRRGGVNIGGATTGSYTLTPTSQATDDGAQFDVIVSNASGSVTSVVATLTVLDSTFGNGLALWLQGGAGVVTNSPEVSQWTDQSGNDRHATQGAGGSQPLLVNAAVNGKPAVRFDGGNDFLTFNLPVNGLSEMTILLVSANTQNQAGGVHPAEHAALFWNESSAWGTLYLSPFQESVNFRFGTTQAGNSPSFIRPVSVGSSFTLTTSVKNGMNDSLYVNGVRVLNLDGKLATIAGCQPTGNLGRGYNDNTFFAGDIAEVLVFTRALSATERLELEAYLDSKYALTTPTAPLIFTQPKTNSAVGLAYQYEASAFGSPPPSFGLSQAPAGMTIDAVTGELNWTPGSGDVGNHVVQIAATNAVGTNIQTFTLRVSVIPPDLIAYWSLDETSGSVFRDFFEVNNAACAGANCPAPGVGQIGPGQVFNGVNTEVTAPAHPSLDFVNTDSFSLEVWIKTGVAAEVAYFGRVEQATLMEYSVGQNVAGRPWFYLRDNQNNIIADLIAPSVPAFDQWHHVVGVVDAAANEARLYVDGVLVNTRSTAGVFAGSFSSTTATLNIGWLNLAPGYNFDGTLDEVALYGRALGDAEILDHHTDGLAGLGIAQDNVPDAPQILVEPDDLAVTEPNGATFEVIAVGTAPLSYQWRRDGVDIGGAINPSYTLTPTSAASDNGDQFDVIVSNASGSVTSLLATLLVGVGPAISQDPLSLIVTQGNTANFSVTASGPTLAYQWRFNGANLAGATSDSLSLLNVQAAQAGDYRVVVSNPFGSVTSAVATLTVRVPPTITQQPVSMIVTQGTATSFTVTATGDPTLAYQWRLNGVNIGGSTAPAHNIPSAQPVDAGDYTVVISNAYGMVTSVVATLTVTDPMPLNGLSLWLRGDAGTVLNGSAVTQWSDQSGNNRHATQATGANQPTLVNGALNGLPAVRFDGANDFQTFNLPVNGLGGMSIFLVAANTQNQTAGATQAERAALFWNESAGWGTVYLIPFQTTVRLRFGTTQAGNQMTYTRPSSAGSNFTLTSAIKNGTTDSLYVNRALVLSESGKLASIAGCQNTGQLGRGFNDNTFFAGDIAEVLVYNRALSAAEQLAVEQYLDGKYGLTAPVPPQITVQPASTNVAEPDAANFSVTATGSAPLAYQWRRGGVNIGGANGSSYTLTPTSAATDNGAQFTVVVSNAGGSVTSSVATLTVTVPPPTPPQITTQPANLIVVEPNAAAFSVVATGTVPLAYQWRRGGANIGGATSIGYTLTPTSVAGDNGAQFSVVVSNASGMVTSVVATLTVNAPGSVPASGLALWLRGDAGTVLNGSAVTQWSDQSGNNRHATQATAANQPTLVNGAINGLPVVRFDGANDFETFNLPVNGLGGMTIFLVAANTQNQTAGATQAERAAIFWNETAGWGTVYLIPFQTTVRMRFGTTQAGNQMTYTRPGSVGSGFTITASIKDGTTDSLYVNGSQVLSQGGKLATLAGNQGTGQLGRGFNDNTFFAGDIAEVLVYDRALSAAERQQVEQYLNGRYALLPASLVAVLPGAAAAELRIEEADGAILVYWPVACQDCVLQEATLSEGTMIWSDVTAPVKVKGTENCAVLPASGDARFFRLRSP